MGMMPVPSALEGYNEKLVGGGSKYFFIDNSVSEEQQAAAKEFLNWLVFEEDGQNFLVNTCALVPAFGNITLPVSDPLGASVKSYVDPGAMIADYRYAPDDHYAKVGISFQKYLADQIDRAGLADEITAYWATAEVGAH
jgi:raffinose/stachyose/melibiose transport system substrate-binding protein